MDKSSSTPKHEHPGDAETDRMFGDHGKPGRLREDIIPDHKLITRRLSGMVNYESYHNAEVCNKNDPILPAEAEQNGTNPVDLSDSLQELMTLKPQPLTMFTRTNEVEQQIDSDQEPTVNDRSNEPEIETSSDDGNNVHCDAFGKPFPINEKDEPQKKDTLLQKATSFFRKKFHLEKSQPEPSYSEIEDSVPPESLENAESQETTLQPENDLDSTFLQADGDSERLSSTVKTNPVDTPRILSSYTEFLESLQNEEAWRASSSFESEAAEPVETPFDFESAEEIEYPRIAFQEFLDKLKEQDERSRKSSDATCFQYSFESEPDSSKQTVNKVESMGFNLSNDPSESVANSQTCIQQAASDLHLHRTRLHSLSSKCGFVKQIVRVSNETTCSKGTDEHTYQNDALDLDTAENFEPDDRSLENDQPFPSFSTYITYDAENDENCSVTANHDLEMLQMNDSPLLVSEPVEQVDEPSYLQRCSVERIPYGGCTSDSTTKAVELEAQTVTAPQEEKEPHVLQGDSDRGDERSYGCLSTEGSTQGPSDQVPDLFEETEYTIESAEYFQRMNMLAKMTQDETEAKTTSTANLQKEENASAEAVKKKSMYSEEEDLAETLDSDTESSTEKLFKEQLFMAKARLHLTEQHQRELLRTLESAESFHRTVILSKLQDEEVADPETGTAVIVPVSFVPTVESSESFRGMNLCCQFDHGPIDAAFEFSNPKEDYDKTVGKKFYGDGKTDGELEQDADSQGPDENADQRDATALSNENFDQKTSESSEEYQREQQYLQEAPQPTPAPKGKSKFFTAITGLFRRQKVPETPLPADKSVSGPTVTTTPFNTMSDTVTPEALGMSLRNCAATTSIPRLITGRKKGFFSRGSAEDSNVNSDVWSVEDLNDNVPVVLNGMDSADQLLSANLGDEENVAANTSALVTSASLQKFSTYSNRYDAVSADSTQFGLQQLPETSVEKGHLEECAVGDHKPATCNAIYSVEPTFWGYISRRNEKIEIDSDAIQKYKKVIEYGGNYGPNTSIILLWACYLPSRYSANYGYVMEHLFRYVAQCLEVLAEQRYHVILFSGTESVNNGPPVSWLHDCFLIMEKQVGKSLDQLLVVHAAYWWKAQLRVMSQGAISKEFYQKIRYVANLDELKKLLSEEQMEFITIPELVRDYDTKGYLDQQDSHFHITDI